MNIGQDAKTFKTVTLTLKLLPCPDDRHGFSGYRRLRWVLKRLLRTFSFKCTAMRFDNGECQQLADEQGGQADG